jgi:biotin carboxyl carrier protein
VSVNGGPIEIAVREVRTDLVVLAEAGIVYRYRVGRDKNATYVDGPDGSWTLQHVDRFPLPDAAGLAGSLSAPMPGSILRVLVAEGEAVHPGMPLVVLEAMKMEHQVVAPAAGTVTRVLVAVGEQVTTGQSLLVLEESS